MVGSRIESLITNLALTPEEFADNIGVGKSTIYKLIRGDTKKITVSMAKKINSAFPEYSVDFLLSFNKVEKSVGESYFQDIISEKPPKKSSNDVCDIEKEVKHLKQINSQLKENNQTLKNMISILQDKIKDLENQNTNFQKSN